MNAEKLHRILLDIQKEYNTNYIGFMREVMTNLTNLVAAPQEPSYQLSVTGNTKALYSLLAASSINDFGPNWKQILHEIGGSGLFGEELAERIKLLFSENTVTPASVLQGLTLIVQESENFKSVVDQMVTGLRNLNIGFEELNPGECEFGYTIPRREIHDQLGALAKEIRTLNYILYTIAEATTGEKTEFEIRTVSSSDIMLYVLLGLGIAEKLTGALSKIVSTYKDVIYIKEVVNGKLADKKVPPKAIEPLMDHANKMMEEKIKEIAHEMIKGYKKSDAGRKQELESGLVGALKILANRIDRGFIVDIRIAELPGPADPENITEMEAFTGDTIKFIKEESKNLEYIKIGGSPILLLKNSEIPEFKEEEKETEKPETKPTAKKKD